MRLAVLHTGADALIHNYREQIEGLLHGEPWAQRLDAVLLFDPYCMFGGSAWELIAAREDNPRVTAVFERLGGGRAAHS